MGHDPGRFGDLGASSTSGGDRGFTLLEVLVAFVIAALALGALMQGAATGLRSVRVSGHVQEALSRARSHLAAAALAPIPGDRRGDDGGGYAWRVNVASAAASVRAVLYAVTVTVSWRMDGGEREVVLRTQRLGPPPPDAP